MGTASFQFERWNVSGRRFWRRLAPRCGEQDCRHTRSLWRRFSGVRSAVLEGSRYCLERCLEAALSQALGRVRSLPHDAVVAHRVPLGLLLLSRQQITVEQLRTALEAQRSASHGRIGDWLQQLGFVSEHQVTAALARQWSCPVLRANSPVARNKTFPQIPVALLESFAMVPVDYVEATKTLHVAFGEGLDYGVLYAIEQMIGCHTEACLAVPSLVRARLQTISHRREDSEVLFERLAEDTDLSRIIRSYCARLSASEIRLASCGPYVWVRLLRPARPPLDLLLRSPQTVH
ncbi:MAG: hypothetical protein WCF26_06695 [Candidatus Sulfotelmatobacter sp.]